MKRYIRHLIRGAELRTEEFLKHQEKDPASLQYGGLKGDIWEAKPTIYALTSAAAVYLNPDSRFYGNRELYQAIGLGLQFVERTQREDGSFDFPSCNFRSAADTAFCFKRLIALYRLLNTWGSSQECIKLRELLPGILHRALEAMEAGGFHTPNHRWAIAAALLQGANLFEKETEFADRLRARAEQYLAEGIDGDEDGEYAERSTGNYNAVVNNAMIALYEETGDKEYLGYVSRNLDMMLYYLDPDDTVFTQNSTRQDKGKAEYADKYFYQYLFMSCKEENSLFDGAAHKLIQDNMDRGDLAPDCLHILMLHREMLEHELKEYGFRKEYRKLFQHAGVLRVKRERYSYTVLNGKSAFLFFKAGSLGSYVKIGESCCEVRNFIPQTMFSRNGLTVLTGTADSWYYLPFKELQGTSDWWQMDQSKREKLIKDRLTLRLEIEELEDGLRLHIKTEGLDRLPLRLEVCLPAGAVLENEHFRLETAAGESMILKDGYADLTQGDETLHLGPGFDEHSFKGHYSGKEKNETGFTLFCNAYTPADCTFELRVK